MISLKTIIDFIDEGKLEEALDTAIKLDKMTKDEMMMQHQEEAEKIKKKKIEDIDNLLVKLEWEQMHSLFEIIEPTVYGERYNKAKEDENHWF